MPGFTVWLTGCPGAGKTTIAQLLRQQLTALGHRVEVLDGDDVRQALSPDLGFTRQDRDTNVRRLGFLANLLSRNGVIAIVAAVSPYREGRDQVRHDHEAGFVEVFVDCSIGELVRRDQKGLYSRALRGEVAGVTGVSDPYEPPVAPEVHVHTDRESPDVSCALVLTVLGERGLIGMRRDGPVTLGTVGTLATLGPTSSQATATGSAALPLTATTGARGALPIESAPLRSRRRA